MYDVTAAKIHHTGLGKAIFSCKTIIKCLIELKGKYQVVEDIFCYRVVLAVESLSCV